MTPPVQGIHSHMHHPSLRALLTALAAVLSLDQSSLCSHCLRDGQASLFKALKEAGVVPVADIVINHRCADAQDENGVWNTFRCVIS
jgi:hypothetical protein